MKIKRALEEVAAEAQKDGYGFEYMRNIRDGSLEMRIFKGRFGERVTLPVREVVEHETSGTGHKLIFDTYFALKDQAASRTTTSPKGHFCVGLLLF